MSVRAMTAGGTSLAGARRTSVLIGIGAAVITAIVAVILLVSGDDPPPGEVAGEPDVSAATDDPSGQALPPPAPILPTRGDGERADLKDAVSNLSAGLRSKRLWATVSTDRADPTVVIIRSALCVDGSLSGEVGAYRAELKAAGATAVRCVAPHGGVMFEVIP